MNEQEAYRLRRAMVAEQIAARGVRDPHVLSACRTVPRHLFVPEGVRGAAYEDRPLKIGEGQTISQPYMVAFMTEALGVGAGARVLEVGTGSGYAAAVLAEVVSEVVSIERLPELAECARAVLERLRYRVSVRVGDGSRGVPEEGLFDGIVVACGAQEVPEALRAQLGVGGRLVIPVGAPGGVMQLRRLTRGVEGWREEELMPVRFVPLVVGEI